MQETLKTLKLRIKDKHQAALSLMARQVNTVWNFCNETSARAVREMHKFLSGYDLQKLTDGVVFGSATTQRRRLVLAGVNVVCFFALLRPVVVYAAEACMPIRFADGDTFSFRQAGEIVRVRVAGFDAPERGQPYSSRATDKLRLLTQAGAFCECYKQDRYGRSVCTVRTLAGANVATAMLSEGFGCIDERFEEEATPADRQDAREALQAAQVAKVGMWAQPSPQCAWVYRREKRNAQ